MIYGCLLIAIAFGSCLDYYNSSAPLSQLEGFKYSGKGINEIGKYNECLRKGWQYATLEKTFGRYAAKLGVCLPIECNMKNMSEYASQYGLDLIQPVESKFSTESIIFLTLLIAYCGVILISTYLHYNYEKYSKNKLIKCFSLIDSVQNLFKIRENNKLGILNGLKIISFAGVVYGHTISFKSENSFLNLERIQSLLVKWWSTVAVGAFFAVDTFFYLGGFVLSYFLLIELEKSKGRLRWGLLYLHRYLRIAPCLAFVIGFDYLIVPNLNSGPLWEGTIRSVRDCGQYWWSNLLFVNNLVPDGLGNDCVGVTWYLAADMQLFIIGPAIVYIYYRQKNKIIVWMSFLLIFIFNLILIYSIAYYYGYRVLVLDGRNETQFYYFYIKPYIKFPVYFQGIISGIIFSSFDKISEKKENKDKVCNIIIRSILYNNITSILCSAIGGFLMWFMVILQAPVYEDITKDIWSPSTNALGLALLKPGFILGLQMFSLPLLMGRNKIISSILGNEVLEPLGKISFCSYLAHYEIVNVYFSSQINKIMEGIYVFKEFITFFVLSSIGGTLLHLTVEVPFQNLEKVLLR
jgi:peptidoglycan/LPS O-acetylase OafA/YrhL